MAEIHTGLPWEAREHIGGGPQWEVGIPGESLSLIFITSQGNDEANAKFIALACNAHKELLQACQLAEQLIAKHIYPQPDKHESDWYKLKAIRDAIAQAEGSG